jgi:hypothetical protein
MSRTLSTASSLFAASCNVFVCLALLVWGVTAVSADEPIGPDCAGATACQQCNGNPCGICGCTSDCCCYCDANCNCHNTWFDPVTDCEDFC